MTTAIAKTTQWIDANETNLQQLVPGGVDPFAVKSSILSLLQADERSGGKISKCTPASIVASVARTVALGLDAMGGDAYYIPYGKELEFSPSPQGYMKILTRAENVAHVDVDVVRIEDQFRVFKTREGAAFEHEPEPFSNTEVVGAYCAIYYTNGHIAIERMNRDEIEQAKKSSKNTSKSGPWALWFAEMAKKSVLKRAAKRVASVSEHDRAILQQVNDIEFPERVSVEQKPPVSDLNAMFPTDYDEPVNDDEQTKLLETEAE